MGRRARARLVVLGVEVVGGRPRPSRPCPNSPTKARGEAPLFRDRAEQAQRLRWGSLLLSTAARAQGADSHTWVRSRGTTGSALGPLSKSRHQAEQVSVGANIFSRVGWLIRALSQSVQVNCSSGYLCCMGNQNITILDCKVNS